MITPREAMRPWSIQKIREMMLLGSSKYGKRWPIVSGLQKEAGWVGSILLFTAPCTKPKISREARAAEAACAEASIVCNYQKGTMRLIAQQSESYPVNNGGSKRTKITYCAQGAEGDATTWDQDEATNSLTG